MEEPIPLWSIGLLLILIDSLVTYWPNTTKYSISIALSFSTALTGQNHGSNVVMAPCHVRLLNTLCTHPTAYPRMPIVQKKYKLHSTSPNGTSVQKVCNFPNLLAFHPGKIVKRLSSGPTQVTHGNFSKNNWHNLAEISKYPFLRENLGRHHPHPS